MEQTLHAYAAVVAECRSLFLAKARDYGTAWSVLRLPSVTDQIMIKANRIRTLQDTGQNRVGDSIRGEFVGIVNYCVIALLLCEVRDVHNGRFPDAWRHLPELEAAYDRAIAQAEGVMAAKNHDYGESWRQMRISSMTDLIAMKILRVKQIEDNAGATLVSEGVEANYIDMLNYAVFCLILGA